MSDSASDSETMIVSLKDLRTLNVLYKAGVLLPSKIRRYPAKASLLDRVLLHQGDITELKVDGIVNAANKSLLGGGGVDGAIHTRAGKGLLDECKSLNGCGTGDAKITEGYNLPARHVIHAVGPVYSSLHVETKAEQLASCYSRSLQLAVENFLKHIAFPAISTGIYGYPVEDATHIALDEVRRFVDDQDGHSLEQVIFVVWSNVDKSIYEKLIPQYFPPLLEDEGEDEKEG